ncbi:DUF1918 domain-containing protein [Streptomyces sp. NPDC059209]|uniref:DUF1918 domain-containing protein n=1 Tax=Streptomyces sp. NPDC059209 TaxID=3346769 RepID=UPI00367F4DD3
MKARTGDHIIIEGRTTGETKRDGEIVGVRHSDGTPPYDVRWLDNDTVTLVYPGPDAHVRHHEYTPDGRRNG